MLVRLPLSLLVLACSVASLGCGDSDPVATYETEREPAAQVARVDVGVIFRDDMAWTCKAEGDPSVIAAQADNFKSWLRSLEFVAATDKPAEDNSGTGEATGAGAADEEAAGDATDNSAAGQGVAEPNAEPSGEDLKWSLPEGWQQLLPVEKSAEDEVGGDPHSTFERQPEGEYAILGNEELRYFVLISRERVPASASSTDDDGEIQSGQDQGDDNQSSADNARQSFLHHTINDWRRALTLLPLEEDAPPLETLQTAAGDTIHYHSFTGQSMRAADAPPPGREFELGERPIPQHWREAENDAFSVAAFTAGQVQGDPRVTITPINGTGMEAILQNFNRWAGQVDLPPLELQGWSALISDYHIGEFLGAGVDIVSEGPVTDSRTGLVSEGRVRIRGAIVIAEASFFAVKMTGRDELVQREAAAFDQFVSSLKFEVRPRNLPAPRHLSPAGFVEKHVPHETP